MDQYRNRLRLMFLGLSAAAVEEVRERNWREVGGDALCLFLGKDAATAVLGDHVSYLVQNDVILVEAAGVLGVGDHVVIGVLLPGAAAVAGTPGDRAQIDVATAVEFEPVEELVDVPRVRDAGVAEEVVDLLAAAGS
jgi:hypothetical protein